MQPAVALEYLDKEVAVLAVLAVLVGPSQEAVGLDLAAPLDKTRQEQTPALVALMAVDLAVFKLIAGIPAPLLVAVVAQLE